MDLLQLHMEAFSTSFSGRQGEESSYHHQHRRFYHGKHTAGGLFVSASCAYVSRDTLDVFVFFSFCFFSPQVRSQTEKMQEQMQVILFTSANRFSFLPPRVQKSLTFFVLPLQ